MEILAAVLTVLEEDPHQFSTRPCQTCKVVSSLAGRPFGCAAKAKKMVGIDGQAARERA